MQDTRGDKIKAFLGQAVAQGQRDMVTRATARFDLSRQTIHKHLAEMVAQGFLEARGRTRGRVYRLKVLDRHVNYYEIMEHPAEDRIWRESFAADLVGLPDGARSICNHGFTEMFNNAIEHSEGKTVKTSLRRTYATVTMLVCDDGIGVFKKIKDGLHLEDERAAILELAKGKVTTEPESHSGEGIFFTSRMFDSFSILANSLFFLHKEADDDWLIETRQDTTQPLFERGPKESRGTTIEMTIFAQSTRTTQEVFERYTSKDGELAFDKTRVPVRLLRIGEENLVSRSQARRLLKRFERFREVVLDFDGVTQIGQAFADEIFRVFKNQNPSIRITVLRANRQVRAMIQRSQAS